MNKLYCRLLLSTIMALPIAAYAGGAIKKIPSGSRIFVNAAQGFDVHLAAAVSKKRVPIVIVADREKAQYVLDGIASHEDKNWASKIFLGHRDTSEATVRLVDVTSGEVIYAYTVHKKNSARGNQSTAEACAKHLKEVVQR